MLPEHFLWDFGKRFCPNHNTELFYRSLIPTRPRLILVMIHGAGQHSGQFSYLGRYCLQHNIAFYALDLRGFGLSSGKRGHVQSFSEYLDDLDSFIEFIRKIHPGDPIFLLGHSLGGTIVIRYSQEHEGSIQGAVLSAPALKLRFHMPESLYFVTQILSRITPGLSVDLIDWSHVMRGIPSFRSFYNNQLSKEDDPLCTNQFSVRWLTELIVNGHLALSKVNDFRIAVLCLCGSDDPLIDPASVQEFHDFLQVKDKKYILVPHAKHRLLQDNERSHVYEHIVNWIKERI